MRVADFDFFLECLDNVNATGKEIDYFAEWCQYPNLAWLGKDVFGFGDLIHKGLDI